MKLILTDTPLNIEINNSIKIIDIFSLEITNCIGCFSCWIKTPGKCIIRDDAVKVYPYIAKSDELIYISQIKYGGYDTMMKTIIERAIPVQQAFIRLIDGETHHIQRAVKRKKATIIAYGNNIEDDEKAIFEELISRNAYNMNFEDYKIIFTNKMLLEEVVLNEVEKWIK